MSSLVTDNNGTVIQDADIVEINEKEKKFWSALSSELNRNLNEIKAGRKRENEDGRFKNLMNTMFDEHGNVNEARRRATILQIIAMDKMGSCQKKQNSVLLQWYNMRRIREDGAIRISTDFMGRKLVQVSIPLIGEWFEDDFKKYWQPIYEEYGVKKEDLSNVAPLSPDVLSISYQRMSSFPNSSFDDMEPSILFIPGVKNIWDAQVQQLQNHDNTVNARLLVPQNNFIQWGALAQTSGWGDRYQFMKSHPIYGEEYQQVSLDSGNEWFQFSLSEHSRNLKFPDNDGNMHEVHEIILTITVDNEPTVKIIKEFEKEKNKDLSKWNSYTPTQKKLHNFVAMNPIKGVELLQQFNANNGDISKLDPILVKESGLDKVVRNTASNQLSEKELQSIMAMGNKKGPNREAKKDEYVYDPYKSSQQNKMLKKIFDRKKAKRNQKLISVTGIMKSRDEYMKTNKYADEKAQETGDKTVEEIEAEKERLERRAQKKREKKRRQKAKKRLEAARKKSESGSDTSATSPSSSPSMSPIPNTNDTKLPPKLLEIGNLKIEDEKNTQPELKDYEKTEKIIIWKNMIELLKNTFKDDEVLNKYWMVYGGGFATFLHTDGKYDTGDIDMKLYPKNEIKKNYNMNLIKNNLKEKILSHKDDILLKIQRELGELTVKIPKEILISTSEDNYENHPTDKLNLRDDIIKITLFYDIIHDVPPGEMIEIKGTHYFGPYKKVDQKAVCDISFWKDDALFDDVIAVNDNVKTLGANITHIPELDFRFGKHFPIVPKDYLITEKKVLLKDIKEGTWKYNSKEQIGHKIPRWCEQIKKLGGILTQEYEEFCKTNEFSNKKGGGRRKMKGKNTQAARAKSQ